MTKNEHKVVQRCAFTSVYAGAVLKRRVVWAACFDGQGVSDEISTTPDGRALS